MDKPIPTNVHGVLDYLTAPTLLILPRVLKWNKTLTTLLTGAGLATLGYSLITRYELGVFKVLPMPLHLAIDAVNGATLLAAPFLLQKPSERDAVTTATLLGLGVFELSAALLTQPQPIYIEAEMQSPLKELVKSAS